MAKEKRLIYADEVKTLIKNYGKGSITDGRKYLDPEDDISLLAKGVDPCRDVDAEEVVHGWWEDEYGGAFSNPRYRCSVCKEKALYRIEQNILGGWETVQALTDCCPSCGEKMDGGRKDN